MQRRTLVDPETLSIYTRAQAACSAYVQVVTVAREGEQYTDEKGTVCTVDPDCTLISILSSRVGYTELLKKVEALTREAIGD